MRGLLATGNGEAGGADGLKNEEQEHSGCRQDEEQATTGALDAEGSADSPDQVPDGENTDRPVSLVSVQRAGSDTYAVMSSWIVVFVIPMDLNTAFR